MPEKKRKEKRLREGETPEERAARKAAKRSAAALFGYTNDSNPFGDSNLHEQFVWRKKAEKQGVSMPDKRQQRDNHAKKVEEIVKVRKRRDDSEKEKEEMERLRAEEARLREQQQFGDWQKKEEDFHLAQAKMRSKIRLVEGRQKPIDLMAKNVLLFGENSAEEVGVKYRSTRQLDTSGLEMELREPYQLFEGLSLTELLELQRDVANYVELEGEEGPNAEFWQCLATVCAEEVRAAKARDGIEEEALRGVHSSVLAGVHATLAPLSLPKLRDMASEVTSQLESAHEGEGGEGVDVDYFEVVLRFIGVYEAKARLRAMHQEMLQRRLDRLEEVRREMRRQKNAEAADRAAAAAAAGSGGEEEDEAAGGGGAAAAADGEGAAAGGGAAASSAGRDASEAAAELYAREAKRGMEDLEDAFDLRDEVDVTGTIYGWGDKFRPRKPRYFNRVKTGYDWNKYNQAHYDHDNPPPKAVQGYKFNVFYPDLVDKTSPPRFVLEPADSDDFIIIRFTAGPPYEDVAFKIVNREWETSRKRGFRVVFDRGVLSVCFNFKRARYRR